MCVVGPDWRRLGLCPFSSGLSLPDATRVTLVPASSVVPQMAHYTIPCSRPFAETLSPAGESNCVVPWACSGGRTSSRQRGRVGKRLCFCVHTCKPLGASPSRLTLARKQETLRIAANLAGILEIQGDIAAAALLQRSTFESHRRALGPEHPETLATRPTSRHACCGDVC